MASSFNYDKTVNTDYKKDPPKDLEAEKSLLGSIILDGTLLARVGNEIGPLNVEDFASEKNRIIYNEILKRAVSSEDFNPTVLCASLERAGLLEKAGGRIYVTSLCQISGPISAVVEYASIVRDFAKRRRLINASETITKISYQLDGRSIKDLFDEAQGLIFKLSEQNEGVDSGPKEALPIIEELFAKIHEDMQSDKKMTGVATGFSELDELTSGLQPGSLNIVAARPGIGKTSFSMNIIENIAMDPNVTKPALVFSLEMPAQQIMLRMLSTFGRVNMKDLSEGKVHSDQWRDMIRKVSMLTYEADGVTKNKLYIDDSGDITPLELRSRARKLYLEHGGLSCIMVDYIQLMKGQTKAESRSLEVGEISRSLKLLAKDLQCPIIALSQLNREVEGRKDHRPMNSDLRESGSLEQDADMIMFLHRDSVYQSSEENKENGKALLIVSKNRNGALKDIELQFQGAYTAFYDKANIIATIDEPPLPNEIYQ